MNIIFIIISYLFTSTLPSTFSCLFQQSKGDEWDKKLGKDTSKKPKYSNCECGIVSSSNPNKTWILYVHSKLNRNDSADITICTGTIIASNLVATSHFCLILADRKISVYDTWRPRPKNSVINVVVPENVTLYNSRRPNPKEKIQVIDIIFSPKFAYSMQVKKSFPEDDVALLVTKDNLFDKGHNSVCLPDRKAAKNKLDVVQHLGFYYDIDRDFTNSPTISIEDIEMISTGKECDKEAGFPVTASENSFCVRYIGVPITSEGGTLMVQSETENKPFFLVGMATEIDIKINAPAYRYTYFSNVISMVTYIEWQAKSMNSQWCKSSDLKLGKKLKKFVPNSHPWTDESLIQERDESLDCACGIQHKVARRKRSEPIGRISGAEDAEPYEFPWMIGVEFTYDNWELISSCGGTLINDRIAITAAHCVTKLDDIDDDNDKKNIPELVVTDVEIFVSRHKTNDDPNVVVYEIDHVHYHPDYIRSQRDVKESHYDSDIALLVLKTPLNFTKSKTGNSAKAKDLRPICLPKRNNKLELTPNQDATVIGWGWTDPEDPNSYPENLQKLQVPILDKEECSTISKEAKEFMTENTMCAGFLDRTKDHQKGDSGGPLMVQNGQGAWTQVGIVSFGFDDIVKGVIKKTIRGYADLQKLLNFVDFYSGIEGAKWCRSA